jgi:hypothetical protein
VWVSSGSDTQNMEGTQNGLSWFGFLSPTSSSMIRVLRVRNAQSGDYNGESQERLVQDRQPAAIIEFFGLFFDPFFSN